MKLPGEIVLTKMPKAWRSEDISIWNIGKKTVFCGKQEDEKNWEQVIAQTVGSYDLSMCFQNELRFDASTLELVGLSLFVPEILFPSDFKSVDFDKVSEMRSFSSGIALEKKVDGFKFELAEECIFDKRNNQLIGASKYFLENFSQSEICMIAKNFGLFFTEGELSGWVLRELDSSFFLEHSILNDIHDVQLVDLYVNLFNKKTFEAMEEEDEHIKNRLDDALKRLNENRVDKSSFSQFLTEEIENCLEFYW